MNGTASGRHRGGSITGIALGSLLIGGLLGAIAGLDPILPDLLPPMGKRWFFRDIPLLPAAGIAVLALAAVLIVKWADRLPRRWGRYYLMALIATIHTYSLPGVKELNHLVVGGFALLWLMDLMRRAEARLSSSPLQLLVAAWVGIMLLSTTTGGGFLSLRSFVTEAKGFLLFLLVLHALERWSDVRFFIGVLLVITTVSALIGIGQEILFKATGDLYVGAVDSRTRGLLVIDGTPFGAWLRPPGFFGFSEVLSNALAVASAMALALLIAPGRRAHRWWLAFGVLTMLTTLAATTSRGAMLGFALAALAALVLLRPRWLPPLALAVTIGTLAAFYVPSLRHTVDEYAFYLLRAGNIPERFQYIQEVLPAGLQRHPILGNGLNMSERYNPNAVDYPVHNALLMAFGETGVIGLLVYTMILVYIIFRVQWGAWAVHDPERRITLIAIGCGLVALLTHLQTDPFYHLQMTWLFLPLVEAAVQIAARAEHRSAEVLA